MNTVTTGLIANGRRWLLCLVIVSGIVVSSDLRAQDIRMLVQNGSIPGDVEFVGWEDWFDVGFLVHNLISTGGDSDGIPGDRRHAPVYVAVHQTAVSTPLFMAAIRYAENLVEIRILLMEPRHSGPDDAVYEIVLTNPELVDISTGFSAIGGDTGPWDPPQFYHILGFSYQEIEWTHVPSGMSHSEHWIEPVISEPAVIASIGPGTNEGLSLVLSLPKAFHDRNLEAEFYTFNGTRVGVEKLGPDGKFEWSGPQEKDGQAAEGPFHYRIRGLSLPGSEGVVAFK